MASLHETTVIRGNSLYSGVEATSWTQAQSLAVQTGGNLAGISSAEEDEFIWNNFREQDESPDGYNWGYWIGLQREPGSNHELSESWSWINGDATSYLNTSFVPGNPSSEPNGGPDDLYTHVWGYNEGTHITPLWNDARNNGNGGSFPRIGVAEIPLNLTVDALTNPEEGLGVFATSITLTAGSETTENLAEGAEIYWSITGITSDDLASGSLEGTGFITDGELLIDHSLVRDDDTNELFRVSVFSDPDRTQQIGTTAEFLIEDNNYNSPEIEDISVIRGNSLYTNVAARTWTEAQLLAVEMGGNLATINSLDEDNFLWNNFRDQEESLDGYNWGYWIGLQRDLGSSYEQIESWNWSNDEELEYLNSSFSPGTLGSEPNGGYDDVYTHVWGYNEGTHETPLWNDTRDDGNRGSSPYIGVAEIPLNLTIDAPINPEEGAGIFITSITISTDFGISDDLTEGVEIYWSISGITTEDLTSGALEGSEFISNSQLTIQHSLAQDHDSDELFRVSIFSDEDRTQQIGRTAEFLIEDNNNETHPTPAAEPTTEPEPDLTPESVVEPEPTTEPEPDLTPESDIEPEPTTEPEPDLAPESVVESEPTTEPEPDLAPESDVGPEPTTEPEGEGEPAAYDPPNTENRIKGSKRDDDLRGTKKADLITGKKGDDTLSGSKGDDVLRGDKGNDFLNGSKGNDYLDGSKGSDVLTGGKGADVFQISKGVDTITDFSIKDNDRIGLDKKGNYSIINAEDGVLIQANARKQFFLTGAIYEEIIHAGVELFVQPI